MGCRKEQLGTTNTLYQLDNEVRRYKGVEAVWASANRLAMLGEGARREGEAQGDIRVCCRDAAGGQSSHTPLLYVERLCTEEFDLALNYRFAQIARARLRRRKPDRKADWYVQGVRRERK